MATAASTVLVAGRSGRIWNSTPGVDSATGLFSNVSYLDRKRSFRRVAFAPGGARFATVDAGGDVFLFRVRENRYSRVASFAAEGTAICFASPAVVAVGLTDGTIRLVDVDSPGSAPRTLEAHRGAVASIAADASQNMAVSAAGDGLILWDTSASEWKKRKSLAAGGAAACGARFAPADGSLLTCFSDEGLTAWSTNTFMPAFSLNAKVARGTPADANPAPRYTCFAVSSDGSLAATGEARALGMGALSVWDVRRERPVVTMILPSSARAPRQVVFLPGSRVAAVLGDDGSLLFVDTATRAVEVEIPARGLDGISSFRIGPTGKYMAGVTHSGKLKLFDLEKAFVSGASSGEGPRLREAATPGAATPAAADSKGFERRTRVSVDPGSSLSEAAAKTLGEGLLSRKKLRLLLRETGQFPKKYRLVIWSYLLRLPRNTRCYARLVSRGTHPALRGMEKEFPVADARLFRRLEKTVSCLAHWSGLFAQLSYAAPLAFPFLLACPGDDLRAFELLVSFLLGWAQEWFEFFPNPPVRMLARIGRVVAREDPALARAFARRKWNIEDVAWSLLSNAFSTVLPRNDWLQLFDHVFANHPSWLAAFTASFILCARSSLLAARTSEELDRFLSNPSTVDVTRAIARAARVRSRTRAGDQSEVKAFSPIPKGSYPIWTATFPKFEVDAQLKERERIAAEEEALAARRANVRAMQERLRELLDARDKAEAQAAALSRMRERRRAQKLAENTYHAKQKRDSHALETKARLDRIETMTALARERMATQGARERELGEVAEGEIAHAREILDGDLEQDVQRRELEKMERDIESLFRNLAEIQVSSERFSNLHSQVDAKREEMATTRAKKKFGIV